MSLKVFNAKNAPHKKSPKNYVSLSLSMRHTGRFCVSSSLIRAMSNPPGVVLLQDSQYPTDFYLRPCADPDAFTLKKMKRGYSFRSNTMAGIISAALGFPPPPYSVVFKVKDCGDGLFALAVRKPIFKSR